MIAIIDYDMGNVGSIENIFHHIGIDDVCVTRSKQVIHDASHIILPGVGAFDTGMAKLEEYDLIDTLKNEVRLTHKPLLGICLGMQLLGRTSQEGIREGLCLIDFDSIRFGSGENLQEYSNFKVPHMGWNQVLIQQPWQPIVSGLEVNRQRYYFVHSYHAVCDDVSNSLMSCVYGYEFSAAVIRDNIIGVQFHPEKSHRYGMQLLTNFAKM